jgi:hypothetical protein
MFVEHGSPSAKAVLKDAYRDAHRLAKRWRTICAPAWMPPLRPRARGGRHTLAAYMDKLGYVVPSALGPNQTGQRLKAVREMLIAREFEYARLTRTVKGKWTKVLGHNRHDCFGMRHVCLLAAAELEESAPPGAARAS